MNDRIIKCPCCGKEFPLSSVESQPPVEQPLMAQPPVVQHPVAPPPVVVAQPPVSPAAPSFVDEFLASRPQAESIPFPKSLRTVSRLGAIFSIIILAVSLMWGMRPDSALFSIHLSPDGGLEFNHSSTLIEEIRFFPPYWLELLFPMIGILFFSFCLKTLPRELRIRNAAWVGLIASVLELGVLGAGFYFNSSIYWGISIFVEVLTALAFFLFYRGIASESRVKRLPLIIACVLWVWPVGFLLIHTLLERDLIICDYDLILLPLRIIPLIIFFFGFAKQKTLSLR